MKYRFGIDDKLLPALHFINIPNIHNKNPNILNVKAHSVYIKTDNYC